MHRDLSVFEKITVISAFAQSGRTEALSAMQWNLNPGPCACLTYALSTGPNFP